MWFLQESIEGLQRQLQHAEAELSHELERHGELESAHAQEKRRLQEQASESIKTAEQAKKDYEDVAHELEILKSEVDRTNSRWTTDKENARLQRNALEAELEASRYD